MGRFFSQWARRHRLGWISDDGLFDEERFLDTVGKFARNNPDAYLFNMLWPLLAEMDGTELLAVRRKQKVQLARYGRLGGIVFPGQDPEGLGWDDIPIEEFQRIYETLSEVLEREGAMAGTEQ